MDDETWDEPVPGRRWWVPFAIGAALWLVVTPIEAIIVLTR